MNQGYTTFQANPERTGYLPNSSGPTTEPVIKWETTVEHRRIASLSLHDSKLILPARDSSAELVALSVEDGSKEWNFTPEFQAPLASGPSMLGDQIIWAVGHEAPGGCIYIIDKGDAIHSIEDEFKISSPLAVDGMIFNSSGPPYPNHEFSATENVYRIFNKEFEQVDKGTYTQSYGLVNEGSHLAAPDPQPARPTFYAKTLKGFEKVGANAWSYETPDPPDPDHSYLNPPVITGDILLGSVHDTLYALDQETGEEIWANDVDEASGLVAAAGDYGYLPSGNALYCFSVYDGELEWYHEWDQDAGVRPIDIHGITITDDAVYIAAKSAVFAFAPRSGELLWSIAMFPSSPPVVANGQLYVAHAGEDIVALSDDSPPKNSTASIKQNPNGETGRDCRECGHGLTGTENYCPQCGNEL